MNKHYITFILLFAFFATHAQQDTVLLEDFQINPFALMDTMPTGDNSNWVNFDQDGLETAFLTDESKQWFWGEDFIDPVDPNTGETNYIGTSLSFLSGFLPGNRNWMILPPMDVTDDSYMLYWKSAPGQLPRYMDGYSVLVSTSSNDISGAAFSDTLFRAASMDEIIGNSQSIDFGEFTFTPGYIHADSGTLTEYIYDNGGGTILNGIMEPHSVSLAAYSGQTIYIAFLHDADDDERIGMDDILITKQSANNTIEASAAQLELFCYPNPVQQDMILQFQLEQATLVSFQIINASGQVIDTHQLGHLPSGQQQTRLHLHQLPGGQYFLRLNAGEAQATQPFVKK